MGERVRRCVAVIGAVAMLAVVTAAGFPTIDGGDSGTGPLGPGAVYNLTVVGRGGVPASGVDAVALNITAVNPSATSFLTVWPSGQPRPTASNLNTAAGRTLPNMVIAKVGAAGQVSIYNQQGTVDVVVDVLGWFGPGGAGANFTSVAPARLLDSRNLPTADGQFQNLGLLGPGATTEVVVAGRGGVAADATAVALNVTAIGPSAGSFLTVWPSGVPRPTASSLNTAPGRTLPNLVIVAVGAGGRVSLFNQSGTVDVAVDVLGYFSGSGFNSLVPSRALDTRAEPTFDHQFEGVGAMSGGQTLTVSIAGRGTIPADGTGVVALNVTAVSPSSASFLTIWPAGQQRPTASNLNLAPGQTVPNMVIAKLGDGGAISIFNQSGSVHVLVDVLGWWPSVGSDFTGLVPARLMDTRRDDPPPPTTTAPPVTTAPTTTTPPSGTVIPGAFCANPGETGLYNGLTYICSNTNQSGVPYNDGKYRWRRL